MVSLGAWTGALAGLAAGLIDGLWSWGALHQFLPGLGNKLVLLLHLALSYAFAGALLGAALGVAIRILRRHTRLPAVLAFVAGREAPPPLSPVARLSFVVAGVPLIGLVSTLAYFHAHHNLLHRKHPGLVIASAIAIAVVAMLLGALLVLISASLIESGLRRLEKIPALSSAWAPLAAALPLAGLSGYAMNKFLQGKLGAIPWGQLWHFPVGLLLLLCSPVALRHLLARIDRRTQSNGERPLLPLALVLVGMPMLALSLVLAFVLASRGIATKPAFVIVRAMGMGICTMVAATFLSLCLARLLASRLSAHAQRPLASPRAPTWSALLLVLVGTTVGAALSWKTISLLHLRPLCIGAAGLGLAIGTLRIARPLSVLLYSRRVPVRLFASTLAWLLLFALVVVTGTQESVRKAQVLHSGLGEPLARVYRQFGDWDRDGYSRWLGGGDCDDWNARVHPNADEIPFDGIDNNCLRGDVAERSTNATRFAALPSDLPDDFNVILITIDTIRADHLGAYGYPRNTSPNIDALAASGTLFQNGWAHAPSTRYSIPALLTGRYPLNVRYAPIPGQWPGLQEENLTIAEVLKAQGFTTGAILNYWYFDAQRKMNQGFDHYDNKNKRLHRAVSGEGPARTSGSSSKEQTDKALGYIQTHQADQFFLWVHYYDPHYDYEVHEGVRQFGDSKIDAYDHEIAYTDQHIGRLLDDLKARGLDDKTVIVLTGDHGEGFGEHGIDLHGYHLYAAQTKVPLIIRVPGATPSVVTMPASHVDVLPTLANLAGAKSSAEMLGQSLLGVITGSADRAQERFVFQQLSYENNNEYRAAASSKCHILYNVSPNLSWELYRVDQDPMEEHDIIDSPGECAGARAALETWYDYSEIPEGAVAALLQEAPTLDTAIQVDFADAIRLVQFKMPKQVRRGETFEIEYTWTARDTPPSGWKVFAHFESPTGGRFTDDHEPPRPFSWWSEGQYIRYARSVTVPKSQKVGKYQLWFGLYKGQDRMSPKAEGLNRKDRRLHLADIEVLP